MVSVSCYYIYLCYFKTVSYNVCVLGIENSRKRKSIDLFYFVLKFFDFLRFLFFVLLCL